MFDFNLSEKQKQKWEDWKKSLPKLEEGHFGAVGGGYSFHFTPTGIGTIIKATREDGYEIDLTEWEYF